MEDKSFDIVFELDEKKYKGRVDPSVNLSNKGMPASFHVILNENFFGELSLKDCKWSVDQNRPLGLVRLVGKQIENHYEL